MSLRHPLFFLLFAISSAAKSQLPTRFLLYGAKEGLSQNSVHAVFRDRDGLVWIGTQDGLNSFDGKNFKVYRHSDEDSNTISDQFVLQIKEDRAGNLWIGTRNGLNCFNKRTGKFARYYTDSKEPHTFQAAVFDFFIQDDNNVVVPEPNLVIINTRTRSVTRISAFPGSAYHCISVKNYRAVFVNLENKLVILEDIRTGKSLVASSTPLPGSFHERTYRAQFANDSTLLVYPANGGSDIYPVNMRTFVRDAPLIAPFVFNNLTVAGSEIYVSGANGIAMLRDGRVSALLTDNVANNDLPPGAVLCIYKDREANLWLGTSGNGVAVSSRMFDHFTILRTGIAGDAITAVAQAGNDLYAGSRSGLYRLADFKKQQAGPLQKIGTIRNITALAVDGAGSIWTASHGEGICCTTKGGKVVRIKLPGNAAPAVLNMNIDAQGRLLIAATTGLYIINPGDPNIITIQQSATDKRLEGNYVMSTFADSKGNIWVSNNLGVNVLTPELAAKFSFGSGSDTASFIKRTIVSSVAENSRGEIWIGTLRNGVYKYADNVFEHYTVSAGLASDVIYNIVCDKFDRLWVTTGAGLNVFDKNKNAFATLTPLDGVPTTGFIFGAAMRADPLIFFGTSDGLLMCNTKKFVLHDNKINAFITDIKVNGNSITPGTDGLRIVPDNKLISMELAASPAFFSGNIIYQYRMVGQRDEWITLPQGVHTVSFTGLPYKELLMQVRAAGSVNNLEKAAVSTLTIHSKAPFWKTTAFIFCMALLFVLLLLLAVREYNKRTYKKQLQQLRLEQGLQGERIRIGRDLHDNIGAYTSALIAGLNRINPSDEVQEKHVADLKEYGSSIMAFLRETIWMLNAEDLTVTAFADRFKNYTLRIGKNYPGIDFVFTEDIIQDKTPQPSALLNLFRILQEALQNACKHSKGTVITVHIESKHIICAQVSDNGTGFEKTGEGEHYGLENMKERAMHSGFLLQIITGASGTVVEIKENTANAPLEESF